MTSKSTNIRHELRRDYVDIRAIRIETDGLLPGIIELNSGGHVKTLESATKRFHATVSEYEEKLKKILDEMLDDYDHGYCQCRQCERYMCTHIEADMIRSDAESLLKPLRSAVRAGDEGAWHANREPLSGDGEE